MLAGHMLLVTFALLSDAMFRAQTKELFLKQMGVLPFAMLVFLVVFEILVAVLQAYIFTILAGVYIGLLAQPGALSIDHPARPPTTSKQENHTCKRLRSSFSRPRTPKPSLPRPAPVSPMAWLPSVRGSASASSSARPSRRWPASRRRPGLVRTTMFLGIAFTEALALIGFVVFILLGL